MESLSSLVLYVLASVGKAMMFKKMGEAPWKAFVPVYSEYILFKRVWDTEKFGLLVALIALLIAMGTLAMASFGYQGMNLETVCYLVGIAAVLIATATITVTLMYKLSKSFGHGVGYALGLIVLEPVFCLLLGFNSDSYSRA